MKKTFFAALTSLTILSLDASLNTIDATSPIVFSTEADGRKWKLGYNAKDEKMSISEYTIEGETLENWTELITVMAIWPSEITLEHYFNTFITNLSGIIPESNIQTKILDRGSNTFLAEWWVKDKSPNAQHEWIKLYRDQLTIYSLRYTTKNLENAEIRRPIWEKILKESKLRSPRAR